MAILTSFQRPAETMMVLPPVVSGPVRRAAGGVEAPDRGDRHREAPEERSARRAEAPDAGYGRSDDRGGGYTSGRSFR